MNLWFLLAVVAFAVSAILAFVDGVELSTLWGITNVGLAFFAVGHVSNRPVG